MATDEAELTPAMWRILGQSFAEAIHVLRFEEPLSALDSNQWSTLLWITGSWILGDTSPTQRTLAALSGLSIRTLRRSLGVLEGLELLRGVRANGSTTDLEVGPRLVRILRDFVSCRDPKIWTRTTQAHRTLGPAGTTASAADVAATTPVSTAPSGSSPVRVAAVVGPPSSLIKKNKNLTSSLSEGGPTPATPTAPTTAQRVDASTARRLALDALAARFQRANPGIPLPRACDAGDVMLVEACTAGGTWDVETLRQTHLDAIEGAFQKAPADRPPTPKYIWGQLRFFLAHAAIGRAKRLQAAAAPKPKKERPPEDPPASSEWLAQHMREARARLDTLPTFSRPKAHLRFGEDAE